MERMNRYRISKRWSKNYPSLYDNFEPGDRVTRIRVDKNGKLDEYKGIIMRMNGEHLEIFWDIMDGKYRPSDIEVNFTNCSLNDIFEGSDKYTPIKREGYKNSHRYKLY